MTEIVTFVPGLPRIRAASWSKVMPEVEVPFTAVIWSPARTPAPAAGEPAITRSTTSSPFVWVTRTPIPATVPLSWLISCWYS